MRLSQIQEQIGRGQYEVDAHAVADAIVRRLVQGRAIVTPEDTGPQGECS
jgi:hypothetical protein